jgi:hypothetical protein
MITSDLRAAILGAMDLVAEPVQEALPGMAVVAERATLLAAELKATIDIDQRTAGGLMANPDFKKGQDLVRETVGSNRAGVATDMVAIARVTIDLATEAAAVGTAINKIGRDTIRLVVQDGTNIAALVIHKQQKMLGVPIKHLRVDSSALSPCPLRA